MYIYIYIYTYRYIIYTRRSVNPLPDPLGPLGALLGSSWDGLDQIEARPGERGQDNHGI